MDIEEIVNRHMEDFGTRLLENQPTDVVAAVRGALTSLAEEMAVQIVSSKQREKNLRSQARAYGEQVAVARREISETLRKLLPMSYSSENIFYSPEAQQFIVQDKWIHAIKQLREDNPGLSLQDAKRFTDMLRTGLRE